MQVVSSLIFASWLNLIPDNVNLIGVELPGHGMRAGESLIDDIKIVVKHLISEFYFNKPYIIFGHSLGACIAYEFVKNIDKHKLPAHLYISGQDTLMTELHLHYKQNDKKLINNLKIYYEQLPEVILNDPALLRDFLDVLRADLKIIINYKKKMEVLPVPITVMHAKEDKVLNENIIQWKKYTSAAFDIMTFAGDHFYLNDEVNKKLIIKAIVNQFQNL